MKKIFIGLAIVFILLVGTVILVPIIFKSDIQALVDQEIDNNLNAKAYYNTDAFRLSILSSFPNLTVSIGDFGIKGIGQFENDTLLSVTEFALTIDIMSVISGDQIKIKNIFLDNPRITVLVLEDGSANYDIVKAGDENEQEKAEIVEGSSEPLSIAIEGWIINEADIIYYDQTLPFYITMFGTNHSGTGDFSQDVFDMTTTTSIKDVSLGYDGDEYVSNKQFAADIVMAMDLANMKFTFKENKMSLNDFAFGFDGFVSMPADDIDMDITYEGKDIDLKGVLSLIPGLYQDYMEGVSASGKVGFNGFIKGTYNDTSMPQLATNFAVNEGKVSYSEYPIPMDQINISASFDYPSADLRESSFIVENFSMKIDGEPLSATLIFKDFEDFYWDFGMDGNLDLGKISKIIPIEGMDLKGKINATLQTVGKMSDLDAERYEKLTTSGSMSIKNFSFVGEDLPQGFGITSTQMSFNPNEIILNGFAGNAGNTDLNMSGKLSNYMQFILSDSAVLKGNLNFASSIVDLNEWMTETEGEEVTEEDTTALEVIRVPTNIDFILASSIDVIQYDNLELKGFNGSLIIRDGAIIMDKVKFGLLDGDFIMSGTYATTGDSDPEYDFDMDIKELSIPESYKSFSTVQQLAPFAEKMKGNFSMDLKIAGTLGSDMMPVYETMQGAGMIAVAQASMADVKLLTAVSKVTSLDAKDGNVSIKDIELSVEIHDGRVFIEPFDIKLAGYTTTISGSNSVMGELDYVMSLKEVPTGAAGKALNAAASSFLGTKDLVASKVDINMGVGGTFTDTNVKLLGISPSGTGGKTAKQAVKEAVADRAKEELNKQKEAVAEKAEEIVKQAEEELKEKVAEKAGEVAGDKIGDAAKNAAKDLLGKKKKKKGGGYP